MAQLDPHSQAFRGLSDSMDSVILNIKVRQNLETNVKIVNEAKWEL